MEKDDDVILDPVVDIAKLFYTSSVLGNFFIYVFPKQLSPTIFKWRRKLKKSHFLQPFIDLTKRRKIRKERENHLILILCNIFPRKQEQHFTSG